MSEETVVQPEVAAEVPASEQSVTATPAPEENTPVENEGETKPAKVFTQDELDAIVQKRLAQERRKQLREQQLKEQVPVLPQVTAAPTPDQFGNDSEAYLQALAAQKAAEMLQAHAAQQEVVKRLATYHEKEEAALEKYPDFAQVAYNQHVPITPRMAEQIQAEDNGPEIAYFLGSNIKEAVRIANLDPQAQIREVIRLGVKLAAEPPKTKQISNAPAPYAPLTPKSISAPAYDTTDPRSIKTMSTSEWIEADRERQRKKWAAQRTR